MSKQLWLLELLFLIPASIGGWAIYTWIQHDFEGFLTVLLVTIFLLPLVLLYIFKNPDVPEDVEYDKWAEEIASWEK